MELKEIPGGFTVCKLADERNVDLSKDFFFLAKTDEELSLVCRSEDVPAHTISREDGWKAFRIQGVLDFSMIGILSEITTLLAENRIGLFAVSTFNTDYVLVKDGDFLRALEVLKAAGHTVAE